MIETGMKMAAWRRPFIAYGNFLFRYRNYLFPLVLVVIILVANPGKAVPAYVSAFVGILVVLSGQAVRVAVIGLDYIKRGGKDKKVAADNLVVTGIFAHCRNPLYVGNLLILCGLLIAYGNLWACIAGVLFFYLSYSAIIMAEENFIAAKFGDEYKEYCRNVPRWFFRIEGLYSTLFRNKFNWQRVINKDYTTMTTWMISLVLLFTARVIHEQGFGTAVLMKSSAVIIAVLIFTSTVKYLKKSGYLSDTPNPGRS